MIKTDDFGRVTVGGMLDQLLVEYDTAGRAIMRGAISAGYDERILRELFEHCFKRVMEVSEDEEQE